MAKKKNAQFAKRVNAYVGIDLTTLRSFLAAARKDGSDAALLIRETVYRVCENTSNWSEILEIVRSIPKSTDHEALLTAAIATVNEACQRERVEDLIGALTLKADHRSPCGYTFALRIAEAARDMHRLPTLKPTGALVACRIGVAALALAQFGYLQGEDAAVRARPRFLARWWEAYTEIANGVGRRAKDSKSKTPPSPWHLLKIEISSLMGGMPPAPAPVEPAIETRKTAQAFPPINVPWTGTDRRGTGSRFRQAS
ncbi:MAG: hypothetical protein QG668_303 [Patescibacteria group bacterium]|nr:hypothetical protein [Patescibacteria group bacterium]